MNITWVRGQYGSGATAKIAGGFITLTVHADVSVRQGENFRYRASVGQLKITNYFPDMESAKAAAEQALMMKMAEAIKELGLG